jgi:hypothetical protein
VSPVRFELSFDIPEDDILHSHRCERPHILRVPFSIISRDPKGLNLISIRANPICVFLAASSPAVRTTRLHIDYFRVGKTVSCKTDHTPQCDAEVKNEWMYDSIPPYVFKV